MIKYAYFIINKLVILFLKLLFGQPKLLAVTKLMAFFFFFLVEIYQFVVIQKSFCAMVGKGRDCSSPQTLIPEVP